MVQAASPALFSVGTGEGDLLPLRCPLDFVALAFHEKNKIFLVRAKLHRLTDVVHQPELPAFPLPGCPVFPGGHLLAAAFILRQNTEPVSMTDLVADLPQIFQGVGILPELSPGLKAHRVDDEVGMHMPGVAVRSDQDLRPGPGPGGKLQRDLMGLRGRDRFLGREGLDVLIEVDPVHFPVGGLRRFKFQNGIAPLAVDAADEILPRLLVPGLVLAHTVIHDRPHGAQVLTGLPDISHGRHGAPRLSR